MAAIGAREIDGYFVQYSSNSFEPRILLLAKRKRVGWLIFKPNGMNLPADCDYYGETHLHYHLEDFHNIIDLLRNEKPVFLLWSGS